MARTFVKANPDKIEFNGTGPISATSGVPITLAGWCYPDVAGQTMMMCGVGSGASFVGVIRIGLINTNRAFAQKQSNDGVGNASVTGSTPTSVNQWQHVAATFVNPVGPTTVTVYYNGVADGASAAISVPSVTTDRTSIGETPGNLAAGSRAWSGALAEIGMWENVELTAAEIAALAKGYSPLVVHPAGLAFYAPLIRDIQDVRGGRGLTATGTSVSVHPRVLASAGGPL